MRAVPLRRRRHRGRRHALRHAPASSRRALPRSPASRRTCPRTGAWRRSALRGRGAYAGENMYRTSSRMARPRRKRGGRRRLARCPPPSGKSTSSRASAAMAAAGLPHASRPTRFAVCASACAKDSQSGGFESTCLRSAMRRSRRSPEASVASSATRWAASFARAPSGVAPRRRSLRAREDLRSLVARDGSHRREAAARVLDGARREEGPVLVLELGAASSRRGGRAPSWSDRRSRRARRPSRRRPRRRAPPSARRGRGGPRRGAPRRAWSSSRRARSRRLRCRGAARRAPRGARRSGPAPSG
jgi:hypothetical protein